MPVPELMFSGPGILCLRCPAASGESSWIESLPNCSSTAFGTAVPVPRTIRQARFFSRYGHHLMLAAPILALSVPTLIILNMADDLRNRDGHVDLAALSTQLGAPVALVSARQGEGIAQVFDFMAGALAKPTPTELPVLQDVPKCREWAGRVGRQARYRSPAPPKWTHRLDSVFLHPVAGPLVFAVVVLD